jgi:hypothetical protein
VVLKSSQVKEAGDGIPTEMTSSWCCTYAETFFQSGEVARKTRDPVASHERHSPTSEPFGRMSGAKLVSEPTQCGKMAWGSDHGPCGALAYVMYVGDESPTGTPPLKLSSTMCCRQSCGPVLPSQRLVPGWQQLHKPCVRSARLLVKYMTYSPVGALPHRHRHGTARTREVQRGQREVQRVNREVQRVNGVAVRWDRRGAVGRAARGGHARHGGAREAKWGLQRVNKVVR